MLARYQKEYIDNISILILKMAQYGVIIEDFKIRGATSDVSVITFFISVPKESELELEDGSEASGESLANYIKRFTSMYYNKCNPLYSINSMIFGYKILIDYEIRDEVWTEEKKVFKIMNAMTKLTTYTIQK